MQLFSLGSTKLHGWQAGPSCACLQLPLAKTLNGRPVWWYSMKSDSQALWASLNLWPSPWWKPDQGVWGAREGFTEPGCSALWAAFPGDWIAQLRGPGVSFPLSLLHGTQKPENPGSLIEGCCFPFIYCSVGPSMIPAEKGALCPTRIGSAHSPLKAERCCAFQPVPFESICAWYLLCVSSGKGLRTPAKLLSEWGQGKN